MRALEEHPSEFMGPEICRQAGCSHLFHRAGQAGRHTSRGCQRPELPALGAQRREGPQAPCRAEPAAWTCSRSGGRIARPQDPRDQEDRIVARVLSGVELRNILDTYKGQWFPSAGGPALLRAQAALGEAR